MNYEILGMFVGYWFMFFLGSLNIDNFLSYLFEFIWAYGGISIIKILYYYRFRLIEFNLLFIAEIIIFFAKSKISNLKIIIIQLVLLVIGSLVIKIRYKINV